MLHTLAASACFGRVPAAPQAGPVPLQALGSPRSVDLTVHYTAAQDISSLAGLGMLQTVDLSHNRIQDITPLASLHDLRSLHLEGNQVRDIGPLVTLPELRWVNLTGNPLNQQSREAHVTALLARGCGVVVEEQEGPWIPGRWVTPDLPGWRTRIPAVRALGGLPL